jgi:hypothetical protein
MAFLTVSTMMWILIALVAVFLFAAVTKKVASIFIKIGALVFVGLVVLQFLK